MQRTGAAGTVSLIERSRARLRPLIGLTLYRCSQPAKGDVHGIVTVGSSAGNLLPSKRERHAVVSRHFANNPFGRVLAIVADYGDVGRFRATAFGYPATNVLLISRYPSDESGGDH